jgi:hypothetical protein
VRLAPGTAQARLHVRLAQPGRWTIALRSAWRRRIARTVDVSAGARTRILVSGDSMIYGIYEALGGYLKTRGGSVRGDPHAGTGLTRAGFDWIGHSRRLARSARADVAIVFLGTTDGLPFGPAGRPAVECCGPAWTAEYARRVRRIMAAHLRGGRTREYWMLLPPPLSAERVVVFAAINEAVRRAAARFDGEIGLVDIGPIVAPDGVFTREIVYRGKRLVVRVPDGIHLAPGGIHIAAALLARTLRHDGVVP